MVQGVASIDGGLGELRWGLVVNWGDRGKWRANEEAAEG
jgi:hypothetical protein